MFLDSSGIGARPYPRCPNNGVHFYFAPAQQQGTVFGLYHLLSGLMVLPGAVLFGVVWQWLGMSSAFVMAASLTALSAIALRLMVSRKPQG